MLHALDHGLKALPAEANLERIRHVARRRRSPGSI
jgi:hypothetical protein